ncbi:TPA: EpsG family protein [Shewanella algae]|uniref:EpsG family protein n=1 Tax=Shewanella algae TaxID=38313 RepID=UPI001C576F6E|nr:EpsG family protein [Shewanella algae]HDS1207147.1 EpsG family protein [Shewanella algae]
MLYFSIFFISIFYTYCIESRINSKLTSGSVIFLLIFPVSLLYLIQSIQFGVGTDYFNYRMFYFEPLMLEQFLRKKELFFYFIYNIFVDLDTGPQSIFYFASFLYGFSLVVFLKKAKSEGLSIWILLFGFLVCTGIYHNQMNGLRNQMAISIFPLIFFAVYKRKNITTSLLVLTSMLWHSSGVVGFVFYFFKFLHTKLESKISLIKIFLMSLFFYVVLAFFVELLVDLLFPQYSHYIGSSYSEPISLLNILTKLYYLPVFFYAVLLYSKRTEATISNSIVSFGMFVFAVTYWVVLLMLSYGFMFRVYQMFVFFYIFPIYYLIKYFSIKKMYVSNLLLISYLLFPYILKVIVFPKGEYIYRSYLLY